MFTSRSYYGSNARPFNSMNGFDSVEGNPPAEASRSHKEAERRRRQRINAHLSSLRTLLPNPTKTDKASLLAEVVHHVRELRRQVAAMGAHRDSGSFPRETDEATVSCCDKEGLRFVKATICCEDRPGLNHDLSRAIVSVRARPVRAEMVTVGGRTKSVVMIKWGDDGGDEDIGGLKRALSDIVLNRAAFYCMGRAVQGNC